MGNSKNIQSMMTLEVTVAHAPLKSQGLAAYQRK